MNDAQRSIIQGSHLANMSIEDRFKFYRRHMMRCWLLIGKEILRRESTNKETIKHE